MMPTPTSSKKRGRVPVPSPGSTAGAAASSPTESSTPPYSKRHKYGHAQKPAGFIQRWRHRNAMKNAERQGKYLPERLDSLRRQPDNPRKHGFREESSEDGLEPSAPSSKRPKLTTFRRLRRKKLADRRPENFDLKTYFNPPLDKELVEILIRIRDRRGLPDRLVPFSFDPSLGPAERGVLERLGCNPFGYRAKPNSAAASSSAPLHHNSGIAYDPYTREIIRQAMDLEGIIAGENMADVEMTDIPLGNLDDDIDDILVAQSKDGGEDNSNLSYIRQLREPACDSNECIESINEREGNMAENAEFDTAGEMADHLFGRCENGIQNITPTNDGEGDTFEIPEAEETADHPFEDYTRNVVLGNEGESNTFQIPEAEERGDHPSALPELTFRMPDAKMGCNGGNEDDSDIDNDAPLEMRNAESRDCYEAHSERAGDGDGNGDDCDSSEGGNEAPFEVPDTESRDRYDAHYELTDDGDRNRDDGRDGDVDDSSKGGNDALFKMPDTEPRDHYDVYSELVDDGDRKGASYDRDGDIDDNNSEGSNDAPFEMPDTESRDHHDAHSELADDGDREGASCDRDGDDGNSESGSDEPFEMPDTESRDHYDAHSDSDGDVNDGDDDDSEDGDFEMPDTRDRDDIYLELADDDNDDDDDDEDGDVSFEIPDPESRPIELAGDDEEWEGIEGIKDSRQMIRGGDAEDMDGDIDNEVEGIEDAINKDRDMGKNQQRILENDIHEMEQDAEEWQGIGDLETNDDWEEWNGITQASDVEMDLEGDDHVVDHNPGRNDGEASLFCDKRLDAIFEDIINSPPDAPITRRDFAVLLQMVRDNNDDSHTPNQSLVPGPAVVHKMERTFDIRRNRPDELQLKRDVRDLCREILNRPESPLKVPTSMQLRRFARLKKSAHGPDLGDLRLDLASEGLCSEWNKRAAILFADHFVATDRYACDHLPTIQKAFRRHLVTLQKYYKAANTTLDAEDEQDIRDAKRQKAREYRRRSLRHRRKQACTVYEADESIQRFLPIWDLLPLEAMSGDETDHEADSPRYAITQLPWRNPAVQPWFRTFDHLHLSTRFGTDDRALPGQFPHPRVGSRRRESHANAVCGLPVNMYDPDWLETLDPFEVKALNIQPEIDLSFSPQIQRIAARFRKVVNRKTPPLPRDHPSLIPVNNAPSQNKTRNRITRQRRSRRVR